MTIELLQTSSTVAYILAGLFLVISVILFFKFQVPKLFSDLTGRTERRAIAAIRKQNEGGNEKAVSGKTGRISKTDRLPKQATNHMSTKREEKKPVPANAWEAVTDELSDDNNETTVLEQEQETTVLNEPFMEETVVLYQDYQQERKVYPVQPQAGMSASSLAGVSATLVVEVDLFFAESKEVIE